MFRSTAATSDPIEEAVVKATDENLTSENWELILNVCDKVADSPESGARSAVAAMIKRLTHRSANVQLFTLTLANSLAQNCGKTVHQELASKAFTQALVRLTSDRTVHQSVKTRLVAIMEELVTTFGSDPTLGLMEEAFEQVKSLNPSLPAPSKPQKRVLSDADRQKEDEELQMVLKLSLEETKREQAGPSAAAPAAPAALASNNPYSAAPPAAAAAAPAAAPEDAQGTTAASVSRVRALYDLTATEPGELSFRRGDIITVLESVYHDWWRGSLRGEVGIFPLNYVTPIKEPTPEEIQQEAADEAAVFAESKNIERLLALLSNADASQSMDDDELQNLYRSSVAMRQKLVKLIDKYSQKRDELMDLNERFTTALQQYTTLVDTYISQYRAPQYAPQYHY
ncbi:uncharacterized protein V1510DRAFT_389689 [Dipodascopsis tothii]|uniref:uncharacterized protein n=1 Tax=Dipodascopsis tothii TaxID=44089 RepID=UPI0034CFD4DA